MPSAVFLSNASQDSEAARRVCESLRSSGIEVWFDIEGGLEHGDEWDAKIRRHIKECVLFIPIISANTQARQIEDLAPARGRRADVHGHAAEVYAMLDDRHSAFASLQRSLAARDAALAWIKLDPSFRNLHGNPQWDDLLRKVGLADDQLT